MLKKIVLAALLMFPCVAFAQNATTAQPAYLSGNPVTIYQSWSPNGDGTFAPLSSPNGNVASGIADTGNPVKIGGVINTNLPTAGATGQRKDLWLGGYGQVIIGTFANIGTDAASQGLFVTSSGNAGPTGTTGYTFNGSSFDRTRGNIDTTALITLTAASAGVNSADQTNYNGRGVKVGISVTAITGTSPTLTVALQGKDAASGTYYNLLVGTAIATTGFTTLTLYPGETVSANVSSSDVLPRTWRVITTIAGTTPAVTATVGASVIN